jgi:P pilus assembly chaperone PapD
LSLTPVILDFAPDQPSRGDIELFNDGSERLYVVVEPSLIADPGTPREKRVQDIDPQKLGLLATPNRLILEPGQRKYVRVAALSDPGEIDRVFRITIKPVVGDVAAKATGLKIMVGYDVLVIQRPGNPLASITGTRVGKSLQLKNVGNTNAELFNGRQCDPAGRNCTSVQGGRLYAGATRDLPMVRDGPVTFSTKIGGEVATLRF